MIRKFLKHRNIKGFTLIEILLVVAIIVILIGAILLTLNSSRKKSKDASFKQTVRSMVSGFEICCSTEGAVLNDKNSNSGDSVLMCANEPTLFYPNDEAVERVFREIDCPNYQVKIYPGSKNSGGGCVSATINYSEGISYEGC